MAKQSPVWNSLKESATNRIMIDMIQETKD